MALSKIIKEHKLLLGATAILSIGSVAAACMAQGAIVGGLSFASSLFGSVAATNYGDLAKRLRDSSQVLTNEDLAKAAGRAIALGIQEVIRESYPELAGTFRGMVDRTEGYWLGVDRSGESPGDYAAIEEDQLRYAFEAFTGEGDRFSTLDLASWKKLVNYLMEQEESHLPAGLEEYQDVMDAISKRLHEKFPFYLREVLKQDASQGGKAFSGMVLDLLRDNIAQVNQVAITQQNIIQLLQQLDTGIRDELAQIRELLGQHLDLTKARLPIPQNPTALIADKTQDFVGRRYVFAAIRDFLLQKPKGYFVLEGDPGVGKSAILAKFAQRYRGSCLTHFNNRGTDYKSFLKNICTQLIGAYGLDYPALPENTLEDETVLNSLLEEVSQKLPPGKKLVIVVDALDEVDISKQIAGKNVLYLPDFLPDNVYFIVSKRPEQLNLPPIQLRTPFDLMQYPAESVEDARHYVETVTSKSSQIQNWVQAKNFTLEDFWRELVAKSANNFMYLRYVLHDI